MVVEKPSGKREVISRRLIALTPVLLIMGIVAQILLLVAAIVIFIPALIWPAILNPVYQWITRGMARIMAKSMLGRRHKQKAEMSA